MRFVKYPPNDSITEYVAFDENQPPSGDIVEIAYPACIRILLCSDMNSPTLERAAYIPFGDEIEITESEFFTAYAQAHSSIVAVLKDTATWKVMHVVDEATTQIREKLIQSVYDKLLGIADQTGTAP